jgi:hypothetical protein
MQHASPPFRSTRKRSSPMQALQADAGGCHRCSWWEFTRRIAMPGNFSNVTKEFALAPSYLSNVRPLSGVPYPRTLRRSQQEISGHFSAAERCAG